MKLVKCLGCQIILTKEMDGIEVMLPKATRNFYVDGHVPQPHWFIIQRYLIYDYECKVKMNFNI